VNNVLYYGDNLDILRGKIADQSVDLVYLDPPFNSNASYNILFADKRGTRDAAQIHAFEDTWTWTRDTDRLYTDLLQGGAVPAKVADTVQALHGMLGENDLLAYLVMMAPRLVELHRVLRNTGSMYLHCDPTASHFLKIVMDSIFGPTSFRNEVIWKRTSAHSSAKRYGPVHDVLLFYAKSDTYIWNPAYTPYEPEYVSTFFDQVDPDGRRWKRMDLTGAGIRHGETGNPWRGIDVTAKGRHWAYPPSQLEKFDVAGRLHWPTKKAGMPRLKQYPEDLPGVPLQDVWTDIRPLHNLSAERLGYPTQKPQALLERIIKASSNEGDVVLDPFCGCGTTVAAAQALNRAWLGIDITYLAIDLIRRRLEDTYPTGANFVSDGIPRDVEGAEALFTRNPLDFERWAVSMVRGQPNQKQVGDRGTDGVIRFATGRTDIGRALVSVKGGVSLNPAMVRDLKGTVETEKAEMGVLVTLGPPTRGMVEAANRSGTYTLNGNPYPKLQMVSVAELLGGKRLDMPPTLTPYMTAQRAGTRAEQGQLV
jgi:DNA modification methylase